VRIDRRQRTSVGFPTPARVRAASIDAKLAFSATGRVLGDWAAGRMDGISFIPNVARTRTPIIVR